MIDLIDFSFNKIVNLVGEGTPAWGFRFTLLIWKLSIGKSRAGKVIISMKTLTSNVLFFARVKNHRMDEAKHDDVRQNMQQKNNRGLCPMVT